MPAMESRLDFESERVSPGYFGEVDLRSKPGYAAQEQLPVGRWDPRQLITHQTDQTAPQHFLYFLPLPHEQGWFGLGFFAFGLLSAWVGSSRMIA